jgi:cytochrome P450
MAPINFEPLPGPEPDIIYGWRKAVPEFIKSPIAVMRRLAEQHGAFSALVKTTDPNKIPPYVFAFGSVLYEALSDRAIFGDATRMVFPNLSKPSAFSQIAAPDLINMPKHALISAVCTEEWLARYEPALTPVIVRMVDDLRRNGVSQPFDILEPLRDMSRRITLALFLSLEPEDEPAVLANYLKDVQPHVLALEPIGISAALGGVKRQAQRAVDVLSGLIRHAQDVSGAPFVFGALAAARAADGASLTDDELMRALAGAMPVVEQGIVASVAWTLLLLSQHPRQLAKLQDELAASLQGQPLTPARFGDVPYLGAVVKETMRLFPLKPYGARATLKMAQLGDWHLPPNTLVMHSPLLTQTDGQLYDKPLLFLPHRFDHYTPTEFEYQPLGDAQPVAPLVEFGAKLILSSLLQRYRLATTPGQSIGWRIACVLEPAGPVPMFIVPNGMIFPVSPIKGGFTEFVRMPK